MVEKQDDVRLCIYPYADFNPLSFIILTMNVQSSKEKKNTRKIERNVRLKQETTLLQLKFVIRFLLDKEINGQADCSSYNNQNAL